MDRSLPELSRSCLIQGIVEAGIGGSFSFLWTVQQAIKYESIQLNLFSKLVQKNFPNILCITTMLNLTYNQSRFVCLAFVVEDTGNPDQDSVLR